MLTNAPLSVLLCGYGAFGSLHAAAWRQVLPAGSLFVAEPNAAARARAHAEGIPPLFIGEAVESFLSRVDIVDIVAPPAVHLPLAVKALAHGRSIIIEKPAVLTETEAIELLARAGEAGTPGQVGFVLRAHPLTLRAQKLLDEGAVGRLVAVEGDFCGWKRMRADSSVLENDGVHFLDLMRLFVGAPAVGVEVRARRRLGGKEVDDLRIEVAFETGVEGYLRLGIMAGGETEDPFAPGAATTKRLRLIGDSGNIVLDFNTGKLFHGSAAYKPGARGWDVTVERLAWEHVSGASPVALLAASFERFVGAVRGHGEPLCNLSEGALEIARLLDAIRRQIAQPRHAFVPLHQDQK